jgi:ribosomal protein L16 Arg81 hydroxylase
MRGVIAENHWDSTRNAIVVLGGERRYLLSHPSECKHLELYPEGHPSARHSAVDWSKPDLVSYPKFQHALVNEVVLQAGDVLYLPTNWFHHIVSLELNYQCNTRSGRTKTYDKDIADCDFKHL